jgi:hypothetical protein
MLNTLGLINAANFNKLDLQKMLHNLVRVNNKVEIATLISK